MELRTWRHDATNKCVSAFPHGPLVGIIIAGQSKKDLSVRLEIVFVYDSMGNMWADACFD